MNCRIHYAIVCDPEADGKAAAVKHLKSNRAAQKAGDAVHRNAAASNVPEAADKAGSSKCVYLVHFLTRGCW